MAQTVNELLVKISADVDGLKKGLASAENATKKSTSEINRSIETIKASVDKTRGAFNTYAKVAVASITAVTGAMVKSSLDSIDAQAKFADRIGVTTEALAGLQYAAGLTGVQTNQLNLGLQRMTRRIAEAAQGTGEAKNALAELNLDAAELSRLSPDQQFNKIATAMEGVTGQGDRVRLSMRLFDSEGVALVNTLKLGEQGLKDAAKEAENFGIAISRFDASKVEQANDDIARAKSVISGFARALTVEVAPILSIMAKSFAENAAQAGGFGNMARNVVKAVTKGIGVMADGIHGLSIIWEGAKLAIQGFGLAAASVFKVLDLAIVKFGNTIKDGLIFPLKKALELAASFSDDAAKALAKVNALSSELDLKPSDNAREFFNFMLESVEQTKAKIQEIALSGLPSDKIKAQVEEIFAKVDEERAKFETNQTSAVPTATTVNRPAVNGGEAGDKETQEDLDNRARAFEESIAKEEAQRIAAAQRSLETLRSSQKSELEMLLMNEEAKKEVREQARAALEEQILSDSQRQQEILNEAYNNGLISFQEAKLREMQIWSEAEKQMTSIKEAEIQKRAQADEMAVKRKATLDALSAAQSLASLDKSSKSAFKIKKKVDLASAITSGYLAVQNAFANTQGGIYAQLAAAAAAGSKALVQVQAIRKQTFDSGGSIDSSGGSAPNIPAQQAGGAAASAPAQQGGTINLNVSGFNSNNPQALRDLIDGLSEQISLGNVQFNVEAQ